MEAITGLPCNGSRDKGFHVVAASIPYIEREFGFVWKWDGDLRHWRCLDARDIACEGRSRTKLVHRRVKRNLVILGCGDYDKMDEAHKAMALACHQVNGIMDVLASGKTIKQLERAGPTRPVPPDVDAILRLCREREGGNGNGEKKA
jgi:hypothetical protein